MDDYNVDLWVFIVILHMVDVSFGGCKGIGMQMETLRKEKELLTCAPLYPLTCSLPFCNIFVNIFSSFYELNVYLQHNFESSKLVDLHRGGTQLERAKSYSRLKVLFVSCFDADFD